LAPGEKKTVEFMVNTRDISIWNTSVHNWEVQPGLFSVEIGSSSRDIKASGNFTV